MADKEVKTTVEKEETQAKKPVEKKAAPKKEKKDNWFVRTGRKAKNWMSDHPFLTAAGGAIFGSGATIGVAELGRRVSNNRQQQSYIPQDNNSLDPNA